MKEFFKKYGRKFQPQDAIEMMCEKVYEIRELIYQEDELHMEALKILSEMIDDYAREVGGMGYKFKGKEFQEMQGGYNPLKGMYNEVNPIYGQQGGQGNPQQGQGGGGNRHFFPIYPMYPFFGGQGSGRPSQGGSSGGGNR